MSAFDAAVKRVTMPPSDIARCYAADTAALFSIAIAAMMLRQILRLIAIDAAMLPRRATRYLRYAAIYDITRLFSERCRCFAPPLRYC